MGRLVTGWWSCAWRRRAAREQGREGTGHTQGHWPGLSGVREMGRPQLVPSLLHPLHPPPSPWPWPHARPGSARSIRAGWQGRHLAEMLRARAWGPRWWQGGQGCRPAHQDLSQFIFLALPRLLPVRLSGFLPGPKIAEEENAFTTSEA